MKIKSFLVASVLLLSACGTTYSPASNVANLDNIDFSDVETLKKGKDCGYMVLGFPVGDARLFDATKNRRIKKVKYVENSFKAFPLPILPVIYKHCVIAYGE